MDPLMQAIACRPCTTSPRRTRSGSPPKALACTARYRQPARDSPMIEHIDDVFVGRDGRAVRFADVGQSGTPRRAGATQADPHAHPARRDNAGRRQATLVTATVIDRARGREMTVQAARG